MAESKITVTVELLEQAEESGYISFPCPHCGEVTNAEPDAEWVFCQHCDKKIEINNPYI